MRENREVTLLARRMDDGAHFSFSMAHDGLAALEAMRAHMPDILVLDAALAQVDGLGVLDRLPAGRRPRVIGGAQTDFARRGFADRGADCVVKTPWNGQELRAAILLQAEVLVTQVDWDEAQGDAAMRLLAELGMRTTLRGCRYLALASALACGEEARLQAIRESIYVPVAQRCATTPQSVERLIRHAVESTMDSVGAQAVYRFFGNTIDPTRGKPTNAQIISLLAQRLRLLPKAGKTL